MFCVDSYLLNKTVERVREKMKLANERAKMHSFLPFDSDLTNASIAWTSFGRAIYLSRHFILVAIFEQISF